MRPTRSGDVPASTPDRRSGGAFNAAGPGKGRLEALHAIIAEKSLIRDKEARILAPDGTRQNWLFDLRKTFLDPVGLEIAAEQFWDLYKDQLPFQVGGIELGAVPLISAIQLAGLKRGLEVNGFIVRRERKNYGLTRSYEGELTQDPIIIIDDTFNSATSAEKVRVVLAQEGKSIRDVFVIIDYENPSGHNWITRNKLTLRYLFTLAQFGVRPTAVRPAPKQSEFAAAWHFDTSGGNYFDILPSSAPAFDADRLYYGSDDGRLWALNKRTGAPDWQFSVAGSGRKRIRSSPAVHEGKVYFGSYAGAVRCIDAEDGKELWRYEGADWIESSPALAPELGMLFIGLEHSLPGRRGSVAALRMADGQKIWEFSVQGNLHASPGFDPRSRLLACGTGDGELLLFDPGAEALVWRLTIGGKIRSTVTFDSERDAVLVGTLDGTVHSACIATGKTHWATKTADPIYSAPLVIGNRVYVTSTGRHLYVMDASTGKILGRVPTRGKIYAPPRLFDGRLYFGASCGTVYEIDPLSSAVTGQLQLPERFTDAIAYDDVSGLFYAKSCDGKIYAFSRISDMT